MKGIIIAKRGPFKSKKTAGDFITLEFMCEDGIKRCSFLDSCFVDPKVWDKVEVGQSYSGLQIFEGNNNRLKDFDVNNKL